MKKAGVGLGMGFMLTVAGAAQLAVFHFQIKRLLCWLRLPYEL